LGDNRAIGESLLNVGFGYYQVGEFDNAQVHWERAQSLFKEMEDRGGQVRAQQSLGLAQTARGEFAAARDALQQSLTVAESAQMAEERAVSLIAVAELDRLEGHYADAEQRVHDAQTLFAQRDDPRGIVESRLLRVAIALDSGDWKIAATELDQLPVATIGNREQKALHSLRSGELAEATGDHRGAMRLAERAIADAKAAHSLGTELSARLLKVRVLAATGGTSLARAELEQARAGLTRYASVPLRLQMIESALSLPAASNDADYREAQVQLARITAWGKAAQLHLLASASLRQRDPQSAHSALLAAKDAVNKLLAQATLSQRASLSRLYAAALVEKAHAEKGSAP
jgi:eukaryotic-like serine/threonine-protein kinase